MDETIKQLTDHIKGVLSKFPFSDQAYMATLIADEMEEYRHECLAIEYFTQEEE